MRIAQLANFVGPTSGGMRVAIDQLGRGYVDAGVERLLIIPGPRDSFAETAAGLIARVRAPRVSATYRVIVEPWRVLRLLERFAPTSIECSDKWTLTGVAGWARRHGTGSVLFSHERLSDMASDWLPFRAGVVPLIGVLNRRLAHKFDRIVVASRYAAGEWPAGTRPIIVPLGVALDTFTPQAGAPPAAGPIQLCHVGRMSHEKYPQLAVATAVELHRRAVDCQLNMYGTGPDLERLRRAAGWAPVVFHGFIAGRNELARCFASSHVALSVCPTETFGLAALEALACGTPVVTADRGGARELVTADCGAWGTPDPAGLADAVQRLIGRLGPELRAAARRRAQNYGWDAAVNRMLAIHSNLTGRYRGDGR